MSAVDGISLSSVVASLPLAETVSSTLHARGSTDQTLRQKSSAAEVTTVALGYEYAALAIGESSRQVQQAEALQEEREERYATEQRREREAALREASEQQFGGPEEEPGQPLSHPGVTDREVSAPQPAAGLLGGGSAPEPADAERVGVQRAKPEAQVAAAHVDLLA